MRPTTGSPSAPRKGAIVVTQDIPLAARAVKAGAVAIAPNGKPFTEDSIGMALATRNLMDQLRSAGEITGGPKPFSPKDRSVFLQSLDREIVRLKRAGFAADRLSAARLVHHLYVAIRRRARLKPRGVDRLDGALDRASTASRSRPRRPCSGPISAALAPAASVDWKPARWLIWPDHTGICSPSK